jgi:hypothetical protein
MKYLGHTLCHKAVRCANLTLVLQAEHSLFAAGKANLDII